MRQLIEITPLTLKRLLNYKRVVEYELKRASRSQWIDMTLDKMRGYDAAREKAGHVSAVAAYAGFLFRVQNGLISYRSLYGEFLLRNALVEILGELGIPVEFFEIPNGETKYVKTT